jgi:restriction endonuclease Mrr
MLVTTGLFNEGARRMASEHPIELIDGAELATMIQKARQK